MRDAAAAGRQARTDGKLPVADPLVPERLTLMTRTGSVYGFFVLSFN